MIRLRTQNHKTFESQSALKSILSLSKGTGNKRISFKPFLLSLTLLATVAPAWAMEMKNGKEEIQLSAYEWFTAVGAGDLNKIKELLGKGASVDLKDMYGWTALLHAARDGHTNIVKLLLHHGAQVDLNHPDLTEQAKQLIIQCQKEVAAEKQQSITLLSCAREHDENSLFDQDYLPWDLFDLILKKACLLPVTSNNQTNEKK